MNDAWPTVADLTRRLAPVFGCRIAAVEGGRQVSYAALGERALRLGNGLRAIGLRPGDRVAQLADNSISVLEAYLGVPSAGLVLLPLNTRLAAAEIRSILEDAGCRALIAGPGFEDRAAEAARDDVTLIGVARQLGPRGYEDLIGLGRPNLAADPQPGDLGYLYYTSGTTGRPKGVKLSHSNVMAGALGAVAACGIGGGDTWLHAGPMFHLADAFAIWGLTWLGGHHVCERFAPEAAVEAVLRERVTHTLMVPTAAQLFADAASATQTRLDGLRALYFGGAPMPAPIFDHVRDHLAAALVPTYGMTETSGLISSGFPGQTPEAEAPGAAVTTVGREGPLLALDLVDDAGAPVEPGEVGEVRVRGPQVTSGYLNRPEETAAALRNGWLHTGDMGRRSGDGSLSLVDRKKDMIISGGENVYPREVEVALERHPGILEAAVIGRPDSKWGESVCAYVRLRDGAEMSLETARVFAREHLAGYKLPRALTVVGDFPRTASGKVAKASLRVAEDTHTSAERQDGT
ncbi:MAG: AMP-binding protein [Bauldia litoralis]